MRIAVLNETSGGDKNQAIIAALSGRGHEIINAGMKAGGTEPELTYIHTGFLSALLLESGRADFVVGSCGTGLGYLISVMQYPGVFCGHILTPLDAWLFTQINGGNAISLAVNQGFGWAGDVNLSFIFDRLFSVESGCGYPAHRKESQGESRNLLKEISRVSHPSLPRIIEHLPEKVVHHALNFPGIREILDRPTLTDRDLAAALAPFYGEV